MGDYHQGAQDGYKHGYNQALEDFIDMVKEDFPDPNPLSSIFTPYIGDAIIENAKKMRKG